MKWRHICHTLFLSNICHLIQQLTSWVVTDVIQFFIVLQIFWNLFQHCSSNYGFTTAKTTSDNYMFILWINNFHLLSCQEHRHVCHLFIRLICQRWYVFTVNECGRYSPSDFGWKFFNEIRSNIFQAYLFKISFSLFPPLFECGKAFKFFQWNYIIYTVGAF